MLIRRHPVTMDLECQQKVQPCRHKQQRLFAKSDNRRILVLFLPQVETHVGSSRVQHKGTLRSWGQRSGTRLRYYPRLQFEGRVPLKGLSERFNQVNLTNIRSLGLKVPNPPTRSKEPTIPESKYSTSIGDLDHNQQLWQQSTQECKVFQVESLDKYKCKSSVDACHKNSKWSKRKLCLRRIIQSLYHKRDLSP